jgi:glycosyltransferase involved in cell wall biosynthesis
MKPVLICAPGADIGDAGSMGRFLKEVAESLSERGCRTIILGARELADAKQSNTVLKFLDRIRLPWLLSYWCFAFQLWLKAGRPVIAIISQEYVLPFGFSKQIPIYHDLIQYFFPRNKKSAVYYRLYLPWVTRRLGFAYCVTSATGRMIERIVGKVTYRVCGVPIEEAFIDRASESVSGDRYRSVWVGTLARHKNHQQILNFMENISGGDGRMAMVVPATDAMRLTAEISARGLTDRVSVFSNLSEGELSTLYMRSDSVISTSKLEGFCMPVLEAALCGCRPIVPNRATFRENFGHFAVLIPPHDCGYDVYARDAQEKGAVDRSLVMTGARKIHETVLRNKNRTMDEIASSVIAGRKKEILRTRD